MHKRVFDVICVKGKTLALTWVLIALLSIIPLTLSAGELVKGTWVTQGRGELGWPQILAYG